MKRRKFSDAFKRRVLAEYNSGKTSRQAVLDKHKLSWSSIVRFRYSLGEASSPTKLARKVPLEALVLLRQAKRAWEAGKGDRGKYCALLALTSMEEK